MEQIWCGLFDRLYIKIGSCIETSEGAGNFSTLKNLSITAMGSDADACLTITTAFQELEKFEGIRKWRNKVIAHNDPKFDAMKYYTEHKMHVSEYQEVIDCLFGVLNTMSELTVRKIYIPPTFYNLFAKDAAFLYLQSLN